MAEIDQILKHTITKYSLPPRSGKNDDGSNRSETDNARLTRAIRDSMDRLKVENASKQPMSQVAATAMRMMKDPAKTQLLAQEAWVSIDQAYQGVSTTTKKSCAALEKKLSHNMGYYGILRWIAVLIDSVDRATDENGVQAALALVSTTTMQEWPAIPIILAKIWKGAFTRLLEAKSGREVHYEGQQMV